LSSVSGASVEVLYAELLPEIRTVNLSLEISMDILFSSSSLLPQKMLIARFTEII